MEVSKQSIQPDDPIQRKAVGASSIRQSMTGKKSSLSRGTMIGNSLVGQNFSASEIQMWERIQARLRTKLGSEVFNSWFGRLKLESIATGIISHSVPTAFLKSWINSHYADILLQLWQDEQSNVLRVNIVVRSAVRSPKVGQVISKSATNEGKSASSAVGSPLGRLAPQSC
jgi:hypothetical protein